MNTANVLAPASSSGGGVCGQRTARGELLRQQPHAGSRAAGRRRARSPRPAGRPAGRPRGGARRRARGCPSWPGAGRTPRRCAAPGASRPSAISAPALARSESPISASSAQQLGPRRGSRGPARAACRRRPGRRVLAILALMQESLSRYGSVAFSVTQPRVQVEHGEVGLDRAGQLGARRRRPSSRTTARRSARRCARVIDARGDVVLQPQHVPGDRRRSRSGCRRGRRRSRCRT